MDSNNIVKEEDDLSFGLQVLGSFSFPMALCSAIDLGIFEIIAKEGDGAKLSSKDIAIKIGTKNKDAPNMLDRLLRMLSCHSVLKCYVHEDTQNIEPPKSFYSLSPKSKCFLIDADGVSLGPLLALAMDKVFYQSWNELNGAILEGGIPFNRIYGMNAFDYSRVEHVAGDMFESVPKGDAILMKWILHDWSDEQCLKLLKNCYKAIPENGKVIVVESILPMVPEETDSAKFGFGSDLFMMTQNPGGKERTQQEFMDLAKSSGFSSIKLICHVGLWVIEFYK
ncbi:putative caffeate O-methyltransferase [Lupinus albus]|uniref:Putative caffeate O-methyltransferase n=1 Tax=Lupinus albus TaxID=3870 RepID=A0A6A4NS78_LUPAL|nr:putative caffeate O-methyltransferase [Lupinus albus]